MRSFFEKPHFFKQFTSLLFNSFLHLTYPNLSPLALSHVHPLESLSLLRISHLTLTLILHLTHINLVPRLEQNLHTSQLVVFDIRLITKMVSPMKITMIVHIFLQVFLFSVRVLIIGLKLILGLGLSLCYWYSMMLLTQN